VNETLHVLVLEDDADTRSNLCDILELDDHVVESAATAEIAFARASWSEISVVILDRKLPDGTADSLLPRIRERAPNAAVIVVTGYADLDSTISAMRLGAYDFILKPIHADALRASLVRLVTLRDAQRRALQSERLAAIGQMITGLAHESRNALQRAQACLEMLRMEIEDRPSAIDLCDRIQKAQDDLSRLYDEVRGYAAPLALERAMCDMGRVWRHAWHELEPARRGKTLAFDEQIEGDATCFADPFSIGQVFRNIFENAIAASPEGGTISVRCRPAQLRGRDSILVTLSDEGPGIPEKSRPRIFEPFFTTKTKGTGLGMAIAKRIIDAHSGEIDVGPSERGAEFRLNIPRRD